ncbi:hypothetical protein BOTBODRAFT_178179 [Botryobasidium botryosum FD-172 SS1]|uniref:Uncharacterized protein n=1 Tax=Botryobasidium botryosum (strain FD-172 SS1) TaxID=930990 RepID=A0A067M414_BOTB1|nr:hypothetical protein BOTBODRAFT_178179 [Botryobasidium botryosum FD-172 SS1]
MPPRKAAGAKKRALPAEESGAEPQPSSTKPVKRTKVAEKEKEKSQKPAPTAAAKPAVRAKAKPSAPPPPPAKAPSDDEKDKNDKAGKKEIDWTVKMKIARLEGLLERLANGSLRVIASELGIRLQGGTNNDNACEIIGWLEYKATNGSKLEREYKKIKNLCGSCGLEEAEEQDAQTEADYIKVKRMLGELSEASLKTLAKELFTDLGIAVKCTERAGLLREVEGLLANEILGGSDLSEEMEAIKSAHEKCLSEATAASNNEVQERLEELQDSINSLTKQYLKDVSKGLGCYCGGTNARMAAELNEFLESAVENGSDLKQEARTVRAVYRRCYPSHCGGNSGDSDY